MVSIYKRHVCLSTLFVPDDIVTFHWACRVVTQAIWALNPLVCPADRQILQTQSFVAIVGVLYASWKPSGYLETIEMGTQIFQVVLSIGYE